MIEAAILAVGRLDLPPETGIPYAGTGFMVADDLVMTNRHVAEIFSSGLGLEGLRFKPGFAAALDFHHELPPQGAVPAAAGPAAEEDEEEEEPLRVEEVVMIHPHWDCALLRVAGLPPRRLPLSLFGREPEEVAERDVVLVGYPARDRRNDRRVQDQLFRGVYQVKRLLPGRSMDYRAWKSYRDVEALTHDASTLGGNSGSAVVDLQTGRVLALHFAGVYLDANAAVPAWELARDPRVVDAGVTFDDRDPFADEAEWTSAWDDVPPAEADA